jgi:FxsC-like protein
MPGPDRSQSGSRGTYFYLSYAHSAPLTAYRRSDPDQWVRRFFHDLQDAVAFRASPRPVLAPGFYDQDIPIGADWKAVLTQALGRAEVFVPLYSPGYFARQAPGREWACFRQRLIKAGVDDPLSRFVPVLWVPLPSDRHPPGLPEALTMGATEPAYAENGMRALLRLTPYQASYRQVVGQLAARIVGLAEQAPVGPSVVPDLDETASAFSPDGVAAVFSVTVAAPARSSLPLGPDPACYGDRGVGWRPFPREQELSLASYAVQLAEQLDFAVLVADLEAPSYVPGQRPGVILIDPWCAADHETWRALCSYLRDLPPWVLPLIVLGSTGRTDAADQARRARAVADEAGTGNSEAARRGLEGVSSLREFFALMPLLVAEAERQYLRHGPRLPSAARPEVRPRLAGSWPAGRISQSSREVPNA